MMRDKASESAAHSTKNKIIIELSGFARQLSRRLQRPSRGDSVLVELHKRVNYLLMNLNAGGDPSEDRAELGQLLQFLDQYRKSLPKKDVERLESSIKTMLTVSFADFQRELKILFEPIVQSEAVWALEKAQLEEVREAARQAVRRSDSTPEEERQYKQIDARLLKHLKNKPSFSREQIQYLTRLLMQVEGAPGKVTNDWLDQCDMTKLYERFLYPVCSANAEPEHNSVLPLVDKMVWKKDQVNVMGNLVDFKKIRDEAVINIIAMLSGKKNIVQAADRGEIFRERVEPGKFPLFNPDKPDNNLAMVTFSLSSLKRCMEKLLLGQGAQAQGSHWVSLLFIKRRDGGCHIVCIDPYNDKTPFLEGPAKGLADLVGTDHSVSEKISWRVDAGFMVEALSTHVVNALTPGKKATIEFYNPRNQNDGFSCGYWAVLHGLVFSTLGYTDAKAFFDNLGRSKQLPQMVAFAHGAYDQMLDQAQAALGKKKSVNVSASSQHRLMPGDALARERLMGVDPSDPTGTPGVGGIGAGGRAGARAR